ncbi:MAG: DUF1415 domain-containing protein [Proteobacteria bacterium]|nr:DUF1415 domain-containing protein [Pseudomonadota bacterium]
MPDRVEKQVRAWLETFVVGLNLCPFARPFVALDSPSANQLRIEICRDVEWEGLQRAFLQELDTLQSSPEQEIATTLLVFPDALQSFEEYLDFLAEAEELLALAGLEGLIQLASFHPDYVFEGELPDAASHYSNRAPYPAIHLLREDMMERVLRDHPSPETIPGDNIKTLEKIGSSELKSRWQQLLSQ